MKKTVFFAPVCLCKSKAFPCNLHSPLPESPLELQQSLAVPALLFNFQLLNLMKIKILFFILLSMTTWAVAQTNGTPAGNGGGPPVPGSAVIKPRYGFPPTANPGVTTPNSPLNPNNPRNPNNPASPINPANPINPNNPNNPANPYSPYNPANPNNPNSPLNPSGPNNPGNPNNPNYPGFGYGRGGITNGFGTGPLITNGFGSGTRITNGFGMGTGITNGFGSSGGATNNFR